MPTNSEYWLRWLQKTIVDYIDSGEGSDTWTWYQNSESTPFCPPDAAITWIEARITTTPVTVPKTVPDWPDDKCNGERLHEEIKRYIDALVPAEGGTDEEDPATWFSAEPEAVPAFDLDVPQPIQDWLKTNLPRCVAVTRLVTFVGQNSQSIGPQETLVSVGGLNYVFPMRSQEAELAGIMLARAAVARIRNGKVRKELHSALTDALITIAQDGKGHEKVVKKGPNGKASPKVQFPRDTAKVGTGA